MLNEAEKLEEMKDNLLKFKTRDMSMRSSLSRQMAGTTRRRVEKLHTLSLVLLTFRVP